MKVGQGLPVSVIIPTWNRAAKLAASINSVLAQTHEELEVIVVDDGSTDNTGEVVSSIKDERLRYHRLAENGGVSNARNIGVKLARHDMVAFNDSDDLWHPDKLEAQLSYWSEHPEDVLVYCAYKVDIPPDSYVKFPPDQWEQETLSGNIFYSLLHRPAIGTPTMLMEKETFERLGGFDPTYPVMEDWEFSIRVAGIGSIGYLNRILLTVEASAEDRRSGALTMETKLAHYEARCMVLARYLEEIRATDRFEIYAGEILRDAERDGLTESVKGTMMHLLARHTLDKVKKRSGSDEG